MRSKVEDFIKTEALELSQSPVLTDQLYPNSNIVILIPYLFYFSRTREGEESKIPKVFVIKRLNPAWGSAKFFWTVISKKVEENEIVGEVAFKSLKETTGYTLSEKAFANRVKRGPSLKESNFSNRVSHYYFIDLSGADALEISKEFIEGAMPNSIVAAEWCDANAALNSVEWTGAKYGILSLLHEIIKGA